jgi:hypothetical protein
VPRWPGRRTPHTTRGMQTQALLRRWGPKTACPGWEKPAHPRLSSHPARRSGRAGGVLQRSRMGVTRRAPGASPATRSAQLTTAPPRSQGGRVRVGYRGGAKKSRPAWIRFVAGRRCRGLSLPVRSFAAGRCRLFSPGTPAWRPEPATRRLRGGVRGAAGRSRLFSPGTPAWRPESATRRLRGGVRGAAGRSQLFSPGTPAWRPESATRRPRGGMPAERAGPCRPRRNSKARAGSVPRCWLARDSPRPTTGWSAATRRGTCGWPSGASWWTTEFPSTFWGGALLRRLPRRRRETVLRRSSCG